MNKLDMESKDIVKDNLEYIKERFPEAVTVENGELKLNPDSLIQSLSSVIIDDKKEKYELTWPGKRQAIVEGNTRTTKTLRPLINQSVNFDLTSNIFIEGENLDALKILQESYLGKIKCIYIDPPYNTGKDFIYKDNYKNSSKEELEISGQIDELGRKLVSNTETNGKFHSDWITMIYSRIKLSRNLLADDGIIYISIDDNEASNLKKICDEIFGENNFIAQIVVEGTPKNDPYVVSTAHEYCLVYSKNFDRIKDANYGIKNPLYSHLQQIYDEGNGDYSKIQEKLKQFYLDNSLNSENISNYKYADERGIFRIGPIDDPQRGGSKDTRINPKTGAPCLTPAAGWRCNIQTWNEWIKDGLIMFPDEDNVLPAKKTYITEDRLDVMKAYFKIQTRKDTDYLKRLFGLDITPFSNPKPKELLKTFFENCNDKNMIVLDFFAGSGSTAEALWELNAADNGNRKFILVQIPQILDEKASQSNKEKKITEAAINYLKGKNLETTISEITKERLRLSGARIAKNLNENIDVGFRVFKIDSSNMKDEFYMTPDKISQEQIRLFEDNIKEDRTPDDLITQVLLNLGLKLDLHIEEKNICGNKVFDVDDGELLACFDNNVSIDIIEEISKINPRQVVFRDSSFATDQDKVNFEERLKRLSAGTKFNVL